jgi:hypothetical protein
MNEPLLNQITECILADPSQFNMANWQIPSEDSSCGTTGCIAGWAVWLAMPSERDYKKNLSAILPCDFEPTAQEVLGITWRQGIDLFYVSNWPEEFQYEYFNIKYDDKLTVKQRQRRLAKVTARRIQFFIENGY